MDKLENFQELLEAVKYRLDNMEPPLEEGWKDLMAGGVMATAGLGTAGVAAQEVSGMMNKSPEAKVSHHVVTPLPQKKLTPVVAKLTPPPKLYYLPSPTAVKKAALPSSTQAAPAYSSAVVLEQAAKIVEQFEGFSPTWYKCPAGYNTIGYGERTYSGKTITKEQAHELLKNRLASLEHQIKPLLKKDINSSQMAALISLAYNVGFTGVKNSTILRLANAGEKDQVKIRGAFNLWNKITVGGKKKESAGLTRRRNAETDLFIKA